MEVPPLSAVYIQESVCLVVSKAMYGTRAETLHFKVRELCCKTSQYVSVGSGHPFLPHGTIVPNGGPSGQTFILFHKSFIAQRLRIWGGGGVYCKKYFLKDLAKPSS